MKYLEHDYLKEYENEIRFEEIRKLRLELGKQLQLEKFKEFRESLESIIDKKTSTLELNQSEVCIGSHDEISTEEKEKLQKALRRFMPWKKGPFNLFGNKIDAEWRSDIKWERIKANISPLEGRKIADIGCNNGYFMYRMASQKPELVLGFEPYPKHWFAFKLMQKYAQIPELEMELLGVEHIYLYPNFFDTVFCLGILYHHTDPVGLLRKMRESLRPGGEIVIDCQGIDGDDSVALVPERRYTRARGIWFLPTLSCLLNWIKRAQFRKVECFYKGALTSDEQRTSKWAPIDSLKDFLDPNDSKKTIEGYPAPWRFYVKAVK